MMYKRKQSVTHRYTLFIFTSYTVEYMKIIHTKVKESVETS